MLGGGRTHGFGVPPAAGGCSLPSSLPEPMPRGLVPTVSTLTILNYLESTLPPFDHRPLNVAFSEGCLSPGRAV